MSQHIALFMPNHSTFSIYMLLNIIWYYGGGAIPIWTPLTLTAGKINIYNKR